MFKEKVLEFTDEEKCQTSRANLIALILVVIRYLQEQDLDVLDFWRFVGHCYAKGWEGIQKGDIEEVTRGVAINMASCGADLQIIQSDEEQVELVVWGWPDEGVAEFISISQKDAEQMLEVFRPIAASCDLAYDWQQDDSKLTMTIKS